MTDTPIRPAAAEHLHARIRDIAALAEPNDLARQRALVNLAALDPRIDHTNVARLMQQHARARR